MLANNLLFINEVKAQENTTSLTTSKEVVVNKENTIKSQNKSFDIVSFFPMIAVFIIFYLLVIRPSIKKQKDHQELVNQTKVGEKVITNSGIVGVVTAVKINQEGSKEDFIELKIADDVKITILKSAIINNLNLEKKALKPQKISKKAKNNK